MALRISEIIGMNKSKINKTKFALLFVSVLTMTVVLIFFYNSAIGDTRDRKHELPLDKMNIYEQEFSTHLPIIVIRTDFSELYNRYAPPGATIWLFDNETENRLTDTPTEVFELATARYRGHSSMFFPKKPFRLRLYSLDTSFIEPLNHGFFGLAPASEWVLHSPYTDKSLIRNWFSYELAARVFNWQPRGKPVQLFLQNNESGMINYQGVYLLCESITTGESRLDIGEFSLTESETIDFEGGGYVFQIDRATYNHFMLPNGRAIRYSYPTPSNMTMRQDAQLRREVEFIYDLLTQSGEFANVAAEDWDYRSYIDIGSYIDYFLVAEMVGSLDSGDFSTYMYRAAGGLMTMGPLWDCDLSMGNFYYSLPQYDVFVVFRGSIISSLFSDSSFATMLIDRWAELRSTIFSDDEIFSLFNAMVDYISEAAVQNAERWPEKYDGVTYVWPNPEPFTQSWEEEIERTRLWLENRLLWLDRNIHRLNDERPKDIDDYIRILQEAE
jgi:hypothetical protein